MDRFYLVTGALGAVIGGIYMIWSGVRYPSVWRAAKSIYMLAGLLDIYLATIYFMTLLEVLPIPGYGVYIRPVLLPIVLSPAAIAFINKRVKKWM
jgi:hypothetical protein